MKPEFWTSESNGRLTREARLVFLGLFTQADDEGRFRAALPFLAGAILPYDDDNQNVVRTSLEQLERLDKIKLYQRQGFTYGVILKWREHQKPRNAKASNLPEPPGKVKKRDAHSSAPQVHSAVHREGEWEGNGEGDGKGEGVLGSATQPTVFGDSTVISPLTAKHVLPILLGWIKEKRTDRQLPLEPDPTHPSKLKWWNELAKRCTVTLGGLKLAYVAFLRDEHWVRAVPAPWPIRAFAVQWCEQGGIDLSAGATQEAINAAMDAAFRPWKAGGQ